VTRDVNGRPGEWPSVDLAPLRLPHRSRDPRSP